ncbi:MAG: hypothetical protein Q8P41_07675 [Pseudomonadota bacterium]|nr:hypothetical protein [Pseudomonadota bacterium]
MSSKRTTLLVRDAVKHIPDVEVLGWRPILDVVNAYDEAGAACAGAYLVGFFDEVPATVDLGGPGVLYIGETHGPSQSLRSRVESFARSAGLVPGGVFFHSGGERLAERAPDVDPKRLSVALVPFQMKDRHPPDARGILPQLVEKTLLAAYLRVHGALPRLNQDGRYMPADWDVALSETFLAECAGRGVTKDHRKPAEAWLRATLATAYKVRDVSWIDRYQPWIGVEVTLSRGWYAYLGGSPDGAALDFSLWSPENKADPYFQRAIATPDDARHAAWDLHKLWNYGP